MPGVEEALAARAVARPLVEAQRVGLGGERDRAARRARAACARPRRAAARRAPRRRALRATAIRPSFTVSPSWTSRQVATTAPSSTATRCSASSSRPSSSSSSGTPCSTTKTSWRSASAASTSARSRAGRTSVTTRRARSAGCRATRSASLEVRALVDERLTAARVVEERARHALQALGVVDLAVGVLVAGVGERVAPQQLARALAVVLEVDAEERDLPAHVRATRAGAPAAPRGTGRTTPPRCSRPPGGPRAGRSRRSSAVRAPGRISLAWRCSAASSRRRSGEAPRHLLTAQGRRLRRRGRAAPRPA